MNADHQQHHELEHALAVVLAAVAALGFVLWASTGLAGVLSGTGWPRLPVGALATALLKLPTHLAQPRMAWPPRIRAHVAGPAAFYPALALVLGAIGAATAGLVRLGLAHAPSRPDHPNGDGARWSKRRDLAPLRSHAHPPRRANRRGEERSRLALGHRGRRLLRAEARHALVVFGPPQSGKSAGIAIPALLEWPGPAVASSIKTDLYAATARRRHTLGEVLVFDPYGLSPAPGSTWSPLRAACSWDGALSTALRMTAAAELDTTNVKGGSYWAAAAEQRLAPLLWAAANTGGGIGALVRWAYGHSTTELSDALARLADTAGDARTAADAQSALEAHIAFDQLAGDTRSSIESTVQMLLRAYRSPRVQASAISSEITPERVLNGNTLYLIGDSHRSKLLRPLFLALLQELIDHAYHQATLRGGQLHQPLLLCLDELGNVAPLPNLAEIASTAPSHNIQLVSVFHDIAQARTRYGPQAHTVINSHRARMLLPGVADLETLRYFSDLLGEQHTRDKTDGSRGAPPQRRPLAAPEALRQLADGQALLIYGRLAPTKLRLRLYHRDRHLRHLANPPDQP